MPWKMVSALWTSSTTRARDFGTTGRPRARASTAQPNMYIPFTRSRYEQHRHQRNEWSNFPNCPKRNSALSSSPVAVSSNASSPVIEARSLAPNNDQRNANPKGGGGGGGGRHRNLALRGVGSGGGGGGYGGARGEREEEEGAASASPSSPPNSLFREHRHHQQTSPSSEVRSRTVTVIAFLGERKERANNIVRTSSDGAKGILRHCDENGKRKCGIIGARGRDLSASVYRDQLKGGP